MISSRNLLFRILITTIVGIGCKKNNTTEFVPEKTDQAKTDSSQVNPKPSSGTVKSAIDSTLLTGYWRLTDKFQVYYALIINADHTVIVDKSNYYQYGVKSTKGIWTLNKNFFVVGSEKYIIKTLTKDSLRLVDEDETYTWRHIRSVAPHSPYSITLLAGVGANSTTLQPDNSPALNTTFGKPVDLAIDKSGLFYILNSGQNCIRIFNPKTNLVSYLPGTVSSENGTLALRGLLYEAVSMAMFNDVLYIASNNKVYKYDANTQSLVSFTNPNGYPGKPVDGSLIKDTNFSSISDITFDKEGNLYVCDDNFITKVSTTTGVVNIVIGSGQWSYSFPLIKIDYTPVSARSAMVRSSNMAFDSKSNIYFTDAMTSYICKYDAINKTIQAIAGSELSAFSPDGTPANQAGFYGKTADIAVDGEDNIYFTEGARIRKIDSEGKLMTIAGTNYSAFSPSSNDASSSGIGGALGKKIMPNGDIYYADFSFGALYKLSLH